MGRIIGIDLGTTNSVVAIMEAGNPVVIPNDEGDRKTPSVVAYTNEGERLVGAIAKRQAILNAEQTVYSIKRFMGRRFAEVREESKFVPFSVVAAPNGDARIEIEGRKLHPTEITAQVLLKLKRAAEDYLGEPVSEAVITVPAYFNDAQRQATKDAGTIAGLDVKRLVNEPTAAAIAYGFDKKEDQTVAVYDFGGGTFDISILAISDSVIRVLATNGDTHLGGDNIDDRIVQWLLEEFHRETGIDLSGDKVALQRLKDAAEKVKIELSSTLKREISLPFLAADAKGPKHLVRELTRSRLEMMMEDLLNATITPTLTCLADAQLKPTDVDEVVLVGGTTRIPKVQQVVKTLFMKEPNRTVNPDEVVAIGAAVQAAILTGEVKDMVLLDVTPLSLGIQTRGGLMTKIINKNTTIPVRETQVFTTSADCLMHVEIHVLQGERETVAGNRTLGHFRLEGIPPAPRGVPRIEVTFDIDSSGIVGVSAKDLATGAQKGIEITGVAGLTSDEVDAMVMDAAEHEAEDLRRRSLVETKISAERLVAQAQRFAHANAASLGDAARTLQSSIDAVVAATGTGGDIDHLGEKVEELQRDLYAASSAIYDTVVSAPGDSVAEAVRALAPPAHISYSPDGSRETDLESSSVPAAPRKRTFGEILAGAASRFAQGRGKPKGPTANPNQHVNGTGLPVGADAAPSELLTPHLNGAAKPPNAASQPPPTKPRIGPRPNVTPGPVGNTPDSNAIADPDDN